MSYPPETDRYPPPVNFGSAIPNYRVGNWYCPCRLGRFRTSEGVGANHLSANFAVFQRDVRVDRIGLNVKTAAAGGLLRLGLYDDNGNLYPSNLIVDAGEADASTIGDKEFAIDVRLRKGRVYWLVAHSNVAGLAFGAVDPRSWLGVLGTDVVDGEYTAGWVITRTYAALPSTFPAGAVLYPVMFNIMLRIAEVY